MVSVLKVSLYSSLLVVLTACGGGGSGNDTTTGNQQPSVIVVEPEPDNTNTGPDSDTSPETNNGEGATTDPNLQKFAALAGIWDLSFTADTEFGGTGIDERYMILKEDGAGVEYDYEGDGFGSDNNCYTTTSFRLIPLDEDDDYTYLPDDADDETVVLNFVATTNFLNVANASESYRYPRATQFLNEADFVPVCALEQESGNDNADTSTDGDTDGEFGVEGEDFCDLNGSAFNWNANCQVSQFDSSFSSYVTGIQGVLWCQGYGSGTRDEFIDGIFGPLTEQAVAFFQQDVVNQTAATEAGVVDQITWQFLQEGTTFVGSARYEACSDVFFEFVNDQWFVGITNGIYQSMTGF
jgi:peptidoglycan hydrolase-like protein with peptidoglycan-binding domain